MVHGRDLEARDATANDYALDDLNNDGDAGHDAEGNRLLQELDYMNHSSPTDKYADYHFSQERLPPRLKWRIFLLVNGLASLIHGYGVSCASNIEGPIQKKFWSVDLLPLVSLTYPLAATACVPLASWFVKVFDLKVLYAVSVPLIVVGHIIAGASPNMKTLLAGRAVMAAGGSLLYQCALAFNMIHTNPRELILAQSWLASLFAIGLVGGPLIGGAIAESPYSWRWAFFGGQPVLVLTLVLILVYVPRHRVRTTKSVRDRLKELDWIGYTLHASTVILFSVACAASGPAWESSEAPTGGAWALFGAVLLVYTIQQFLGLGTGAQRRTILPCALLRDRTALLTAVCTACAGAATALVVYYTPIYFVLMRIHTRVDATSRLVPFLCAFVASALLVSGGGLLAYVRAYKLLFMFAAAALAVGSGLLHALTPETSDSSIRAYEALIGAGVGALWNLASPVCAVVLTTSSSSSSSMSSASASSQRTRALLDQAALHALAQVGGMAAGRAAAAVLFHGAGSRLLRTALADAAYSDADVRELLAGIKDSAILAESNPDTVAVVFEIVARATARCFSVLVAASVACFAAACCLRPDEIDFSAPALAVPGTGASVGVANGAPSSSAGGRGADRSEPPE